MLLEWILNSFRTVVKSSDYLFPVVEIFMKQYQNCCFRLISTETTKSKLSAAFLARVPVDDVWIRAYYPRPRFSVEESLTRHMELADPSMMDNMDSFVYADLELNMRTKKKVLGLVVLLDCQLECLL